MAERGRYKTRQRELVAACLEAHPDQCLTVDEIWRDILLDGKNVGRSTVYRNLEAMVHEGSALKATAPGGEASYRIATELATGQLVCLSCGRAYPLDCHAATDFSAHLFEHHGFRVELPRTVLYGTCANCMKTESDA